MTSNELHAAALDNWRAAKMFLRKAETVLDERWGRKEPLSAKENEELLHNVSCFGAHFHSAIEQFSETPSADDSSM